MIDDRKWRILNNNINKSVKAKIGELNNGIFIKHEYKSDKKQTLFVYYFEKISKLNANNLKDFRDKIAVKVVSVLVMH